MVKRRVLLRYEEIRNALCVRERGKETILYLYMRHMKLWNGQRILEFIRKICAMINTCYVYTVCTNHIYIFRLSNNWEILTVATDNIHSSDGNYLLLSLLIFFLFGGEMKKGNGVRVYCTTRHLTEVTFMLPFSIANISIKFYNCMHLQCG